MTGGKETVVMKESKRRTTGASRSSETTKKKSQGHEGRGVSPVMMAENKKKKGFSLIGIFKRNKKTKRINEYTANTTQMETTVLDYSDKLYDKKARSEAVTPRKKPTREEGSNKSMEVDDVGMSKLIQIDELPRSPAPCKALVPAKITCTTPIQAPPTPMKDSVVTMYDSGKDYDLVRIGFLRSLRAMGWPAIEEEFRATYRPVTEVNRDTRYVIKFNVPPDGDFYAANHVEIPKLDNKFIIAAAPTSDMSSMETFWRLAFDAQVMNIFYVEDHGKIVEFVPWKAGESKDYGKMTVINKKTTEGKKEGKQAVLEILPDGCSNSIIVRFIQCLHYPQSVARDHKKEKELNHPVTFTRLLKDVKGLCMVVCNNGCGKSAIFILLHAAIARLNSDVPLSVPELLAKIRADRWGSIQNIEQYLAFYQLLLYYIGAKSKPKSESIQIVRELMKSIGSYTPKKA